MNTGRLINMVLRMLMRSRRQNARKGGIGRGGNPQGRRLRSALRFSRLFRRF